MCHNHSASLLISTTHQAIQTQIPVIEPNNFNDAWFHPDDQEQKKWREAIQKELGDIQKRNVWSVIDKKGQRTIGLRWVFKIKQDLRYRARLVALGYRQVMGVDYNETYSPMVND